MLRSNKKLEDIKKKLIPLFIKRLSGMNGRNGRKRSCLYKMLFQNVEEPEHVAMLMKLLVKTSSIEKCIQFSNILKERMKKMDPVYWGNLYKALEGVSCFGLKQYALSVVRHGNESI